MPADVLIQSAGLTTWCPSGHPASRYRPSSPLPQSPMIVVPSRQVPDAALNAHVSSEHLPPMGHSTHELWFPGEAM
eukprot:2369122-Rhodomonas_salina.3